MRTLTVALCLTMSVLGQDRTGVEIIPDAFELPELEIKITPLKSTQLATMKKMLDGFAVLDPNDDELTRVQKARMLAAEEAVQAHMARWIAGLQPLDSMLKAQENFAKAAMDTLDEQDRLLALMYIVNQRLMFYRRVSELSQAGARGGDYATLVECKAGLLEAYAAYLKEKKAQGK